MMMSLRQAVMAARSVSREEPKPMPVLRCPEPPPPPPLPPPEPQRDWLLVASGPQHDAHVIDYQWAPVARTRFEDIRRAVCVAFGVSRLEIISRRNTLRIARPRMACMYLARNCTSMSFPQIARVAGNFDHTTVCHAMYRVAELRAADPEFDAALLAVERQLSFR